MAKKKGNKNKLRDQEIIEDIITPEEAPKEEIKDEGEINKETVDSGLVCDEILLSQEQLLTIKVSHMERDLIQKDITCMDMKSQLLGRERELCALRISDLKSKAIVKDRSNKEIIDHIGRQFGINLNKALINWETGKVTFS